MLTQVWLLTNKVTCMKGVRYDNNNKNKKTIGVNPRQDCWNLSRNGNDPFFPYFSATVVTSGNASNCVGLFVVMGESKMTVSAAGKRGKRGLFKSSSSDSSDSTMPNRLGSSDSAEALFTRTSSDSLSGGAEMKGRKSYSILGFTPWLPGWTILNDGIEMDDRLVILITSSTWYVDAGLIGTPETATTNTSDKICAMKQAIELIQW